MEFTFSCVINNLLSHRQFTIANKIRILYYLSCPPCADETCKICVFCTNNYMACTHLSVIYINNYIGLIYQCVHSGALRIMSCIRLLQTPSICLGKQTGAASCGIACVSERARLVAHVCLSEHNHEHIRTQPSEHIRTQPSEHIRTQPSEHIRT